MSDLAWDQKLDALNGLALCTLHMREPGNWYVRQRVNIGGDGILSGAYGNGASPADAVEDHWRQLVNELPQGRYLVVNGNASAEHAFRWNGFRWYEVERTITINGSRV